MATKITLPSSNDALDVLTELQNQLEAQKLLNQELSKENRQLRISLTTRKELAREVASAVAMLEPYPPLTSITPKQGKHISVVQLFSDWHIGEMISANETEGLGEFNLDIAKKRVAKILENHLQWLSLHEKSYRVDELVIFLLGDFVSGDIHEEFKITNEFPLPIQIAEAANLLSNAIREFARAYKKITVYAVAADNHGRLSQKPQYKQKAANNANFLVYTITSQAVAALPNVKFITTEGMKFVAEIQSHKFLLEHGDTVRGWMGIPMYGFERLLGREARRRMQSPLLQFEHWCIGHWHQPMVIGQHIIVNGSLTGTNEYDHAAGRLSPPAQVAFMLIKEHGIFNVVLFHG